MNAKPNQNKNDLLKSIANLFPHTPEGGDTTKQKRSSAKAITHNGVTWADIENPSKGALQKLAQQYDLNPLHVDQSLASQQLPLLEKEKNYLFLALSLPNYSEQEKKIASSQVRIFLGKNFVITLHDDTAHNVREWLTACEQDTAKAYIKNSTAFLVYSIVASILAQTGTLTQEVLQALDDIEDSVFDDDVSDVMTIGQIRQRIIKLKRVIKSSRLVLRDLSTAVQEFTGEHLSRYYKSNEYLNEKLAETIEEAQETIEVYKDADFTTSTEKTNRILAILTIIFTFGIPATVIGTFYGMNILLPGGVEIGPWMFFGTYTTLIILLAASILPAILMYWYFKKKKWF